MRGECSARGSGSPRIPPRAWVVPPPAMIPVRLTPSSAGCCATCAPTIPDRVGWKSRVLQLAFVTRGFLILAGHSRFAGTNRPFSFALPFCPRVRGTNPEFSRPSSESCPSIFRIRSVRAKREVAPVVVASPRIAQAMRHRGMILRSGATSDFSDHQSHAPSYRTRRRGHPRRVSSGPGAYSGGVVGEDGDPK